MTTTLPYSLVQDIEFQLGKDKAAEFINHYENLSQFFEEKANGLALQKKIRIKR